MTASPRIPVNPDVLTWARQTAGMSVASAARQAGVSSLTVEKWEGGVLTPTLTQLRKLAAAYDRPLAVLFAPAPIQDHPSTLADFRDLDASTERSHALTTAINRARNQRENLVELAQVSPDSVPQEEFAFTAQLGERPDDVAERLRSYLDIDGVPENTLAKPDEFLRRLTRSAEVRGAMVIQVQRIPVKEMRGFSIADRPYPVVALNSADSPRGKVFTLLHEAVHLGLRASALCDMHEVRRGQRSNNIDSVEHYCNDIAAAVLMPTKLFLEYQELVAKRYESTWPLEALRDLSRRFGASSEAALLRLINLGITQWSTYWLRKPQLDQAYAAWRAEERQRRQASGDSPAIFYTLKARDLGRGYVSSVLDAYGDDAISSRDLTDYLDLRFDQVERLAEVIGR